MKNLPTGWDDFARVIKDDYYYVDKTRLIGDIINRGNAVTLFTRPRRFGKTLNMSMLKNFFEVGGDPVLTEELEKLVAAEKVEKRINENLTYSTLSGSLTRKCEEFMKKTSLSGLKRESGKTQVRRKAFITL